MGAKKPPTCLKLYLKSCHPSVKNTSLPTLDIEAFALPISQKLNKLSCKSLLQIESSQLYKTIIIKRPKPSKTKNISPLKILCRCFEKHFNYKIKNLERTLPFIMPPLWIPPLTKIELSNHEAKISNDDII